MEVWKAVSGFEGIYDVSNIGRVRSLTRTIADGRTVKGRVLKPSFLKNGYLMVSLQWDGKAHYRTIHTLVAEAFIGPRPDGMQGCHGDGNPANNHEGNLRWDTPKNNQADRRKHGTALLGETCHSSKLTEADVRSIRARRKRGELGVDVAAAFGVTPKAVSLIHRRINWSHIED